jgi:argininosuccinate lyase
MPIRIAPKRGKDDGEMSGQSERNVPETLGGIARTGATGGAMLPALVAWSSSLAHDRQMVREDLVGSAAHVTMLARTKLVDVADATAIRAELFALFEAHAAGSLVIDEREEDVHMAVESELTRRLGAVAGRLHTARSRNDQVALDLRLHVREAARATCADLTSLALELIARAKEEMNVVLPAYTHRQRAQPVSAAFVIGAWVEQLLRAVECVMFAIDRANVSPLGSGACSGTSLPIDRALVARLLGFPRVTANALDTVGDRDFALDWTWAGARASLALGRIAADVVDFSTSEFGFVTLDGEIAAGSSMMPQKKNADVFELVRGKSAGAVGDVVALLTLVKGLPSGYNRDQQEDREPVLHVAPRVRGCVEALRLAVPHVHFVRERAAAAVADGATQATDLAEALVRGGLPFREAYKAVGALVALAKTHGAPLASMTELHAKTVHPAFTHEALGALDPHRAVAAKESHGGTGPRAVHTQLDSAHARAEDFAARARALPTLDALARAIAAEPFTH